MFKSLYPQVEEKKKTTPTKTTGFKSLYPDVSTLPVTKKVSKTPVSAIKSTNPFSYLGQEIAKTVKNIFPSTIEKVKSIKEDVLNFKPVKGGELNYGTMDFVNKPFKNVVVEALKDSGKEELNRISNLIETNKTWKANKTPETTSKYVSAELKTISGLANVAFSPISALFAEAEKIPVLGTIAKAITLPFDVSGEIGKSNMRQAINLLPISKEAKKNIQEATDEIGTLAGQIVLGGKATEVIGKNIKGLKEKFGEQGAKTITEKAVERADNIKAKNTREEIAPTESSLDIVPPNEKITRPSMEVTPEVPIETIKNKIVKEKISPIIKEILPEETVTKPSGIAKSIELKAIEDGLTKKYSDLAEYTPTTFKEQAKLASDFIDTGIENVRKVIIGEQPLPQGLKGIALIEAVERYAKKTEDVNLRYELANSHLITETSLAAQETSLARMRESDSATAKIVEVKKTREMQAQKSGQPKEQIVKEIKGETEKINLPKEELSWDNFLKKIVC